MKSTHLLPSLAGLFMAAGLLWSCHDRNQGVASLKFDSVAFEKTYYGVNESDTLGQAEYSVAVEYPVAGDTAMRRLIQQWLLVSLNAYAHVDTLPQPLATAHDVAEQWAKAARADDAPLDSLRPYAERFSSDYFDIYGRDSKEVDRWLQYEFTANMRVDALTDRLVTYKTIVYSYLSGAHGQTFVRYANFDMQDLRLLRTEDLFVPHAADSLRPLLVEGLKAYWKEDGQPVMTTEQLDDIIWDSPSQLALPESVPGLTPQGIVFLYQSYEIAAYAAGLPVVTIPYQDLPDVLTPLCKELVQPFVTQPSGGSR